MTKKRDRSKRRTNHKPEPNFNWEIIDLDDVDEATNPTETEPEEMQEYTDYVDIDAIPEVTVDIFDSERISQMPVEECDIDRIPEVTVEPELEEPHYSTSQNREEHVQEAPEFYFVSRDEYEAHRDEFEEKHNRRRGIKENSRKRPKTQIERNPRAYDEEQKGLAYYVNRYFGVILAGIALLLIITGVVGFNIYENSVVYKLARVEAGVEVTVADFLKKEDDKAVFAEGSDTIDPAIPGEYHLKIKTGPFTHSCTLYIQDTKVPVAETKDVVLKYGDTCKPEDFIAKITDATATEVLFVTEPNYKNMETQTIELMVKDAGGNETTVLAKFTISPVVTEFDIEMGEDWPTVDKLLLVQTEGAYIRLPEGDTELTMTPGTYPITVVVGNREYTVSVHVLDTVAPVLSLKDVSGFIGKEYKAEAFVKDCVDATDVTYSFEAAPDVNKVGQQTVTVIATDLGGNQTKQTATLTLEADTEPPVIKGTKDKIVYIGDKVSYRTGVKVTDNSGEELDFIVDSSAVKINEAGTYNVIYTATDAAGNSSSVTIKLTVRTREYSLEEVNKLADKALEKIITAGMTDYQKADAIFKYIQRSISYVNTSEKGDYVRAAYEGLAMNKGDCYTFACVSKVMLTQAGIKNMDIERIRVGDTMHFWNLVDVGDGRGWLHFDATPRKDKTKFFLWTDAPLKKYSDSHDNSHNYDRSLYPDIID